MPGKISGHLTKVLAVELRVRVLGQRTHASNKKRRNVFGGRSLAKKKLKAIDLFAGCGGLTLGLKKAGYRVLAAVEIDPLAVETYKSNHPEVQVWGTDIRNLAASRVLARFALKKGDLDLVAGCPPCQGFSAMTTLNGKRRSTDPRNDLIFEFLRFVRVLRPKAVMMENVPRLASNYRLARFKKALRQIGYTLKAGILDAADYAVAQRRRRFILVGLSKGTPEFARPARKKLSVRDVIGKLGARTRRDALHVMRETRSEKVRQIIRQVPKNGGDRTALGAHCQLDCHKRTNGFYDVYGRMAWHGVSPTITGGCCNPSKGRFLHPTKNRCITLREAALLQSFPCTYKFSTRRGKFAVAEMIGNALPPEFIRRQAKAIAGHLIAATNG